MENRLYVFVCQMFAHRSHSEFDQKLHELKALPLMHSIWAARTALTATELKDALRKTLDDGDRILVVEVAGGWASRRAENNLGELLPPKGGPALTLWEAALGRMNEPRNRGCSDCHPVNQSAPSALTTPISLQASHLAARRAHFTAILKSA